MDCELTLDTDGIRSAATLLDEASRDFGPTSRYITTFGLTDSSLGTSPTARDAVARVRACTIRAVELTTRLAAAAADLADSLRYSAADFDRTELNCLAGG